MKEFSQHVLGSFFRILGFSVVFFSPLFLLAQESRLLAENQSSDGRISATWSVSPKSPRLSNDIRLELSVRFDSKLDVTIPEFGSEIGELKIIASEENIQFEDSDTEIKSMELTVVPKTGGKTPLWPILIRYKDRRDTSQENDKILEIPASELEIEAGIDEDSASLDKIPSAKTVIDISSEKFYFIAAIALFFSVVLLLLAKFWRRYKEESLPIEILSVQDIAIKRLVDLQESRLHETDIKQFYVELTGIIRWYIEQQTQIRAPELTTEEFLREVSNRWKNRLTPSKEIRERLRLFLESADMVKFAKFEPSREDVQQAFQRAIEFIKGFEKPLETAMVKL